MTRKIFTISFLVLGVWVYNSTNVLAAAQSKEDPDFDRESSRWMNAVLSKINAEDDRDRAACERLRIRFFSEMHPLLNTVENCTLFRRRYDTEDIKGYSTGTSYAPLRHHQAAHWASGAVWIDRYGRQQQCLRCVKCTKNQQKLDKILAEFEKAEAAKEAEWKKEIAAREAKQQEEVAAKRREAKEAKRKKKAEASEKAAAGAEVVEQLPVAPRPHGKKRPHS